VCERRATYVARESSGSAPKGPKSIARGVSPWTGEVDSPIEPRRGGTKRLSPLRGWFSEWQPAFQGLTPLAIDDRPFGAEDWASRRDRNGMHQILSFFAETEQSRDFRSREKPPGDRITTCYNVTYDNRLSAR
jgi:hypothetical protein